jgi:hypothetical protein
MEEEIHAFLLVPQHWHREPAFIVWIRREVQLSKVLGTIQRLRSIHEEPSFALFHTRRLNDWDDVLKTLEKTSDKSAMSPWTTVTHIEDISVLLGWEFSICVCGDEVTEA